MVVVSLTGVISTVLRSSLYRQQEVIRGIYANQARLLNALNVSQMPDACERSVRYLSAFLHTCCFY